MPMDPEVRTWIQRINARLDDLEFKARNAGDFSTRRYVDQQVKQLRDELNRKIDQVTRRT